MPRPKSRRANHIRVRRPAAVAPPPQCSQLFTVRMWQEDLGGGQREWRGKVQLVGNGDACYFRDWPTLIAFLEQARSRVEQTGAS